MSSIDQKLLEKLDAEGYNVFEAITDANLGRPQTHARPNAFIGIDGKTYWVKGQAQQGLVAELIAGRLAAKVGAGPLARVIRVTREILPQDGSLNHLEGVVVGLEDIRDAANSRDLAPFIAAGQFQPGLIDPIARGRVIVFQSWLGAGDAQVLVGITNGNVLSIDHGDCFGSTDAFNDPTQIVVDIPGIGADVGTERKHLLPAVDRVQKITDRELVEAVSGLPAGAAWRSPVERRLSIAQWLAYRRDHLARVMM